MRAAASVLGLETRPGAGTRSKAILAAACFLAFFAATAEGETDGWDEIQRHAGGRTVWFSAWGGDPAINRYIRWAAERIEERHGVRLVHVKVTDIAESVSRIMAERVAGRDRGGSVDLLWINGENFAALRQADLLWGPWTVRLPNASLVDWQGNPSTRIDMTMPTDGYELPWGTSSFTFFYDPAAVPSAPGNPAALLQWIDDNPGRFSYPQPPSFLGSAFLKQMLMLLVKEPQRLQEPVAGDFDAVTAPLWDWLDRAHDGMWRSGRLFPRSGPAQRELLAVGELDWMMSYNPFEASRAIRQGELHASIRGHYLAGGALANSHFLAIPYNAGSPEAAMLVADFLISPEAQARKADEGIWGDPTILDVDRLAPRHQALFAAIARRTATPKTPAVLLPEPHPSWSTRLERAWLERYVR